MDVHGLELTGPLTRWRRSRHGEAASRNPTRLDKEGGPAMSPTAERTLWWSLASVLGLVILIMLGLWN
jgi:hypothetical protein